MIPLLAQAIAQEVEDAAEDAGRVAEHAAEHGPLFAQAEFWVAVAFVIFVAATARPIARAIAVALDGHAEKLSRQLDEARELREEAQTLLAESKRRQRDAAQEAEDIVAAAEVEADRLAEKAARDLERAIVRRREQAVARIAQVEAEMAREVREKAVDVAIEAAGRALADKLEDGAGEAETDAAIKEIGRHVS